MEPCGVVPVIMAMTMGLPGRYQPVALLSNDRAREEVNMNPATRIFGTFLILFLCGESNAQDVLKLWEGQEKPYYKENSLKEYEKVSSFDVVCAYDVTEPTLTVYKAEGENSGKAVILLPGGGYSSSSPFIMRDMI